MLWTCGLVESGYRTGCDFFKETVHTGLGHGSIYIDSGSPICSSPGLLLGSDPDPETNQKMILKLQILIRNKSNGSIRLVISVVNPEYFFPGSGSRSYFSAGFRSVSGSCLGSYMNLF
jgi:hypothetical protein